MLITLLTWFYISFLCWSWGNFFVHLTRKFTKDDWDPRHFSFSCIIGLSVITVIANWFSLFIPLGNWWVQLLFLLPALLLVFRRPFPSFFETVKKQVAELHIASLILLLSCLLLVLLMCTWTIIHPDTLGYHAQTVKWIEKYKAVPGIVHLHARLGYQGSWFVDNALFNFSFLQVDGTTFLNSTVLSWFFIFIINRINYNFFKGGKKLFGLFWMVLFVISLWSYTQVRLTATSASADFIATLFILAITYLLLEKDLTHLEASDWLIAGFLCIVATTIKLSVAPMLLTAAISALLFLFRKKIKLFFTFLLLSIVTCAPFVARNIITSGYIIFPSTVIDISNVDWKYSPELTVNEKNYITAYAKKPGVTSKEEINAVNKMSPVEWLPGWWQQQSMADKTIIILLVLSFIGALLSIKKITLSGFISLFVLVTLLTGIVFWFMNAPDPRFGFGSILGFIAVIAYLFFKEKEFFIGKGILLTIILVSVVAITAYTGYRLINFFSNDQLLAPLGIERYEYKSFDCDGIKINTPVDGNYFGITPIPCTDLDCDKFSPRGNEIRDGFRAK